MQPKAIGLLLLDVSGPNLARDERIVTDLARKHGYRFTGMLTIRHDTYMPTTLVVETACKTGAAAIIAPGLAHFNGHPRAVALACDLVTPAGTMPRLSAGR